MRRTVGGENREQCNRGIGSKHEQCLDDEAAGNESRGECVMLLLFRRWRLTQYEVIHDPFRADGTNVNVLEGIAIWESCPQANQRQVTSNANGQFRHRLYPYESAIDAWSTDLRAKYLHLLCESGL